METLLDSIYLPSGIGYIIDYQYNSDTALVMCDMLSTPRNLHLYHLDTVQKVYVNSSVYTELPHLMDYIQTIFMNIKVNQQFFETNMPYEDMKYFDTTLLKVNQDEFENLMLSIHIVSLLQTLIVKSPELIQSFSKEFVQRLFNYASKLIPTKKVFEKPVLRQAYNHMMELLINTYHGSAILMPKEEEMDVESKSKYNLPALTPVVSFGFDKDEGSSTKEDADDNLTVIYDERRMNLIKTFEVVTNFNAVQIYKFLRV